MRRLPLLLLLAVTVGMTSCTGMEEQVASTCEAACPKLISCWENQGGGLSYGYSYGYYEDDELGYFSDAYGCGYYGSGDCTLSGKRDHAVDLCVAGCRENLNANEDQVHCIAMLACREVLTVCLGADLDYGY